jgi:hypothetical protein
MHHCPDLAGHLRDCDPLRTDADLARAVIARLLPVPAFETREARRALEEVGEGAVEIDARLLQRVPVEVSEPNIPPTAFGNDEPRRTNTYPSPCLKAGGCRRSRSRIALCVGWRDEWSGQWRVCRAAPIAPVSSVLTSPLAPQDKTLEPVAQRGRRRPAVPQISALSRKRLRGVPSLFDGFWHARETRHLRCSGSISARRDLRASASMAVIRYLHSHARGVREGRNAERCGCCQADR